MPLSPKVRSERRAEAKRLQDPKILKRKRCDNCGDLFRPKKPYPVQKFCCDNCRKEFHANGGNAFGPLKVRLEKLVRGITAELERRLNVQGRAIGQLERMVYETATVPESTPAQSPSQPISSAITGPPRHR